MAKGGKHKLEIFWIISVTMSDSTMYFAKVSSPEYLCWALLEGVTEALQHKPQLPVSHYLLI